MNTSNESTDFHVLSLGRSPDGAGFKHVVVIAVAGGRSCGHVMRCKNRDHWIKESARKGRNGRVLNLPRKTDHRDGEVPKETAHFWSISDSFRGDFQGGALSTKMVRRSILSSFLGKIRETPEKQNLMILPWMMRGPEALTSSSPLSFQLLFLFPSSVSSRAEASSCKMAGMNPGGTSLRILRLPVVSMCCHHGPTGYSPSSSYGGTLAVITDALSNEAPPSQISIIVLRTNDRCLVFARKASRGAFGRQRRVLIM